MSALQICFRDILVNNPKGGDSILLNSEQARDLLAELWQVFFTNPDFWPKIGQAYKIHGYDSRGQQICQIVRVLHINHGQCMHDRFGFCAPTLTVERINDAETICVPVTHFLACQPIVTAEPE